CVGDDLGVGDVSNDRLDVVATGEERRLGEVENADPRSLLEEGGGNRPPEPIRAARHECDTLCESPSQVAGQVADPTPTHCACTRRRSIVRSSPASHDRRRVMRDNDHFSLGRVRWFGPTARLILLGCVVTLVVAGAAFAATRGGTTENAVDTLVIAN